MSLLGLVNNAVNKTQPATQPTTEKPIPYMAKDVDANGLPFYGTGFQGWARKAWADLSDPSKFFQDQYGLSEETRAGITTQFEADKERIAGSLEKNLKWSSWGEDFFGLSAEELATGPAAFNAEQDIASELGNNKALTAVASMARLGRDTTQNFVWGGLAVLGVDDTIMRKIHSTRVGIDTIADRYNDDTEDTWLKKMTFSNPIGFTKDLAVIAGAILTNKTTFGEAWKETGKYRAGSDMAYTMIWDEIARAEFEKGIEEGKAPGLLAQSLGRPGIEIAGSIIGSPSTYLGMAFKAPVFKNIDKFGDAVTIFSKTFQVPWKTVARIPNASELLYSFTKGRVAIGSTFRIKSSLNIFNDVAYPGVEDALRKIENVSDELAAENILRESAFKVHDEIVSNRKFNRLNMFSLDSSGKTSVMSNNGGLVINSVISQYGMDQGIEILQDMARMQRGGEDSVIAALKLQKLDINRLAFSTAGRMTGEILNQLDDAGIAKLVQKHQGSPQQMALEVTKRLESILGNMIPSVDEMQSAARKVKDADAAGALIPDKTRELAEMYKDVPAIVKTVRTLTYGPKAVSTWTSRAMGLFFMDLAPRFFVRSVVGQTLMTGIHAGWGTALDSLATSLGKAPFRSAAQKSVNAVEELIFKRAGMYSARAASGVEKITDVKGVFTLKAVSRAEQIFASKIILNEVSDNILKALPSTVKNLPEYDAVVAMLPKEQQPLLQAALNRSFGDFDDAVNLFRKWTGKGEIEAWRLVEPPETLRKELDQMGLMEKFYDIQQNSESADEFMEFVDAFSNKYIEDVTKEAAKIPWMSSETPEGMIDFVQDMVREGGRRETEFMTGLIQSWQSTYKQLNETVQGVLETSQNMFRADDQKWARYQEIQRKINQRIGDREALYPVVNKVRAVVNDVAREVSGTPTKQRLLEIWKTPIKFGRDEVFNLSKIYPNVDASKITDPKEFKKLMWPAFFEYSGQKWADTNGGVYDDVFENLEELAKLAGSTLEDMVGSQNSKTNPFYILTQLHKKSKEMEEVQAYSRFFRQQFDFGDDAMLSQVTGDFGKTFPNWKGNKQHIVNAVGKPYEEITLKEAQRAISKRLVVPPYAGDVPTEARARWEGKDEFLADLKRYADKVVDEWDITVPSIPVNVEKQLQTLKKAYEPRMAVVRRESLIMAEATRDFVLHDYNKTYFDHAMTYLLGNSFHYWTTQTYKKGIETLISEPKWANWYLAYKEYTQKKHSELPPYFREAMQLPGVDPNNQYFVNLESMINPVYGLTGTDFNDPRKRVDSVSRMVDDMNKLGPSFSPLVQWAVAMHLYTKGKEDASRRWIGRLFPQTGIIKSATSATDDILGKFGFDVDTKPVELDPFVNFLGADVYGENRVVAAMAKMVHDQVVNPATGEPVTQEEMIDASRLKEGDLWDAANEYASDSRFLSDATSFFLGAGLRPRTQTDVQIDQFWGEYSTLIASQSLLSPDEYYQGWENLRDKYSFTDAMLVSRKAGDEQDTALTYNVISRIPPGQMGDITQVVGLQPYMLDAFFEAKGDFNKMGLNEQDKQRFMAGIIDLSAMLAMPNGATREEWGAAKSEYSDLTAEMKKRFGEDISARIGEFFDTEESQREEFLEMNPDVQAAMDFRNQFIVETPILAAYYGGIETVERYYNSQVYNTLDNEFGDMTEAIQTYEEMLLINPKEAKKFKAKNLQAYYDRRSELFAEADKQIIGVAPNIPSAMPYTIRPEFLPESGYQEDALGATQQEEIGWEQWQELLSPALEEMVVDHIQNGTELKYSATQQLNNIANDIGMTQYEMIRRMTISLQQGQGGSSSLLNLVQDATQ
jgi:hypothetical protein